MKITMKTRLLAPPVPTVDHLTAESRAEMGPDNECEGDRPLTIYGANLAGVTEVKTTYTNAAGEPAVKSVTSFAAKSETELKLTGLGIADVPEGGCMAEVSVIAPGGTATLEYVQLIPG